MSAEWRGERLYRRLLRLYPRPFARLWSDEMAATAVRLAARARARGAVALALLWPRLLADLATGALAQRRTAHDPRAVHRRRTHRKNRRKLMLHGLVGDTTTAWRRARRSPAHAVAVVTTLALGIGATTAIFSVVRAVLLEPLPYRDPGRLVLLAESSQERGWDRAQVAPANFYDWQEQATSFRGMAGFGDYLDQAIVTGDGPPERTTLMGVQGDLFGVLGVAPAIGRSFREADMWGAAAKSVVLSDQFWRRRFAADPAILGRRITLDGERYTVLGVMPAGFSIWSDAVDAWRPFGWAPADRAQIFFRRAHYFRTVARLAPGVTVERADAEMRAIAARLAHQYPETNAEMGANAMPLHTWLVGEARRPLLLLLAAAALVLLIASVNVAHLEIARLLARSREIAVRGCLGASRLRLARQILVEGLLLALLGAAVGIVIALGATPALVRLASSYLPQQVGLGAVRPDLALMGFAVALGVGTALLSGAVALRRGVGPRLDPALREGGRSGEGVRHTRTRRQLISAEVALALIVVLAAALLVRTLAVLRQTDPGFSASGVTTAAIALPSAGYADGPAVAGFSDRLLARVRTLPGVEAAGLVRKLPLTGGGWSSDFSVEGSTRFGINVVHREVTGGYFTAMRVPLVAGRPFDERDGPDAPTVVLVNRTLAERYFPGESAVGRRLCFDRHPGPKTHWRTIIGVVGDERQNGLAQPSQPEIFASLGQDTTSNLVLVVRSSLPTAALVPSLRGALAAVDPQLPLFDVQTMDAVVADALARARFLVVLFGLFAGVALALAAVGVYGVTADSTASRRREIAVRLAIGARSAQVVRTALAGELAAVAVGLLAGLVGALGLGRAMASELYGVRATDPLLVGGVAALLFAVAAIAVWLPARRAAGVAPAEVLRE